MLLKIKKLFNNPIYTSLIILLLLVLYISIMYKFSTPEFFTDKDAAWNMLNNIPNTTKESVLDKYSNPEYDKHNTIMELFLFFVAMLFVTLIFKIKTWKDFLTNKMLKNKIFIYLFINLAYPVWGFFKLHSYMIDLDKYVYPIYADSMGIPYFLFMATVATFAHIYYPVVNFFTFIVYNTKITNHFYILIYILALPALIILLLCETVSQYTLMQIPLYLVLIIATLLIISSLKTIFEKKRTILSQ